MERYRKMIAVVLTGIASVLANVFGHEVISGDLINSIAFLVASVLVWRVPNAS